MVSSLVRKIAPGEFQSLIQSTKNAYMSSSSLIIQPKLGQVIFDFKDIHADTCVVHFRRDSGNGILMISSNGISRGYQINSRIGQSVSFAIGPDSLVQIHRTSRSRGDVSILDISLYAETMDAAGWNHQISKCSKHHCLRLIGNDLHASEGAFIHGNILSVQTEPNNMFVNNGEVVKFLGSCKIIELIIGEHGVKNEPEPFLNLPVEVNPRVRSDVPEPFLNLPVEVNPRVRSDVPVEYVKLGNKEEPKPVVDNGLLDTNVSGWSPLFGSKDAIVNISGVVLDRHGSYNIPLKNILSGKKYKIDIDVSRVDGNGKFIFNILPNPFEATVKMATNETKTYTIEAVPAVSSNYSLSVWRHPSSKGRVRITRIVVSGGIETDHVTEPIKYRQVKQIQPPILPEQHVRPAPIQPQLPPPFVIGYSDDHVMKESIRFANYNLQIPSHESRPVSISTTSGMNWLSKIQSSTNNIHIERSADISVCSIDNIKEARKMFLDSFMEDQLNDVLIQKLNSASVIYTPTDQGASNLMDKLEGKDVRSLARAWPYIGPIPISFLENKDFVVLPNRNDQVTRFVIDALQHMKVVVLGARGKYPQNVVPLNEYTQYHKLLWALQQAKSVIDFHKVEDHKSGLLDIAMNLGAPVVTGSWNYMNFSNATFVSPSQEVSGWMLPSKTDIADGVRNSFGRGVVNIQAQKDAWDSFIKEMI